MLVGNVESLWCQCVQDRLREASVVYLLSDRSLGSFLPPCFDLSVWGCKRDLLSDCLFVACYDSPLA